MGGAPGILFLHAGGPCWPAPPSPGQAGRQAGRQAGHLLACTARPGLSSWPNHTSPQPEEAGPEKGAGSHSLLQKSSHTPHSPHLPQKIQSHLCLKSNHSGFSTIHMSAGCALPHFWQIYKWDLMRRPLCLVDCPLIDFNSGIQIPTTLPLHKTGNTGSKI